MLETMEDYFGFALLLAWALVLIWSLGRIAVSAWQVQGDHWDVRSFAVGLLVGVAAAGGVILFVEPDAVLFGIHTIGLGFVLALGATFTLWEFAKAGSL
jgi:hypothetical protein